MAFSVAFVPDRENYAVGPGAPAVIQHDIPGGPPRQRRDLDSSPLIVSVSWLLTEAEYTYMMTSVYSARNLEWIVTLTAGPAGYAQYLCRLMPGSLSMREPTDTTFRVAAELEIIGEYVT